MSDGKIQNYIDSEALAVEDDERLVRLLCSPLYYDRQTGMVSPDAFDLRILGKNKDKPESYVSLGRMLYLDSKEKFDGYVANGNKIKWPAHNPKNVFAGYGMFLCGDARDVHEMVRVHPLKGSKEFHIGLFYVKADGTLYEGPLPKTDADVLEMLADLADLLEVTSVPSANN